jgi:cAMP phosphodiesterase
VPHHLFSEIIYPEMADERAVYLSVALLRMPVVRPLARAQCTNDGLSGKSSYALVDRNPHN